MKNLDFDDLQDALNFFNNHNQKAEGVEKQIQTQLDAEKQPEQKQ